MQLKLAVPSDEIYNFIYENAAPHEIQIFKVDEHTCADLLIGQRVDAALLTPLGYSKGLASADFRIIPGPALASHDYTGAASIAYGENLKTIKSAASLNPENFISHIGQIILKERYNLSLPVNKIQKKDKNTLKEYDAYIGWGNLEDEAVVSDISDDWYDMGRYSLPLAFWVCHNEGHPEYIKEIINKIAGIQKDREHIHEKETISEDIFPRSGELIYEFDENFEEALFQTLQMLYFHRLVSDIPEVKVLGRE